MNQPSGWPPTMRDEDNHAILVYFQVSDESWHREGAVVDDLRAICTIDKPEFTLLGSSIRFAVNDNGDGAEVTLEYTFETYDYLQLIPLSPIEFEALTPEELRALAVTVKVGFEGTQPFWIEADLDTHQLLGLSNSQTVCLMSVKSSRASILCNCELQSHIVP
jgi:hypothetical protein